MINSISGSSQVAQTYQLQHQQQPNQTPKNVQNDKQPQDTVVLSKKASGAGDVDHDGDSH